jgi:two-component sensor histidine kinase
VTAALPESDGEFQYRIKSIAETHERLARESELRGE